jgi:hypothetical protein
VKPRLRVLHYQRLCDPASCELCKLEAEEKPAKVSFEAAGYSIKVFSYDRPVLRLPATGRLFVGEKLSLVNPTGVGGQVWSAVDRPRLDATIRVAETLRHGIAQAGT